MTCHTRGAGDQPLNEKSHAYPQLEHCAARARTHGRNLTALRRAGALRSAVKAGRSGALLLAAASVRGAMNYSLLPVTAWPCRCLRSTGVVVRAVPSAFGE